MMQSLFICPHCGAPFQREGTGLYCGGARRHCFDIAKEGYVNLTPPSASGGGDDAVLINARRAFLGGGHYLPIAERVCELLQKYAPGKSVLDAGCGEGYYTNFLAKQGFLMTGIDLSRRGIRVASKTAKSAALSAEYAVAGIFSLPLADESVDVVLSLFAPVAEEEFDRVLRPGGVLLAVGAGKTHLAGLKRVLYEEATENRPRADAPAQMPLLERVELCFDMQLTGEEVRSLFAMTPYYYRTPRAGHERLAALESLTCGADVVLEAYRKAERA